MGRLGCNGEGTVGGGVEGKGRADGGWKGVMQLSALLAHLPW